MTTKDYIEKAYEVYIKEKEDLIAKEITMLMDEVLEGHKVEKKNYKVYYAGMANEIIQTEDMQSCHKKIDYEAAFHRCRSKVQVDIEAKEWLE